MPPKRKMVYHIINSVAWIPVTAYIFLLLYPWFKPGSFIVSRVADRLIVWFCFHLSLFCLVYATIETFRRYLNGHGRLWSELNRNSYHVYIIHVIVIGAIALVMLDTAIPSLVKYLLLTVSTYGMSNLIISLFRKVSTRSENRFADRQPRNGKGRDIICETGIRCGTAENRVLEGQATVAVCLNDRGKTAS